MITDEWSPETPIPMFSIFEKTNAHREYTVCSFRRMIAHLRRQQHLDQHVYSMIPPEIPVNFSRTSTCLWTTWRRRRGARAASTAHWPSVSRGIDAVIDSLRVSEPSWAGFSGRYSVCLLYSHKRGKQSAHFVLHFEGLHMLRDISACKSFYSLIVKESMRRHRSLEVNPMFFEAAKGGFKCILDKLIYTPYRNFRTVGSYKNKEVRADIKGCLYPRCPGFDETANDIGCTAPDCAYHVRHTFTDADFLSNDPTFIPRASSGLPMVPVLLSVPFTDNPLLKRNQKRPERAASSMLITNFTLSSAGGSSSRDSAITVTPMSRAASLGGGASAAGLQWPCFTAACALIRAVSGFSCEFRRMVEDTEGEDTDTAVVSSESTLCPYYWKGRDPRVTSDNIRLHEHKSNHIFYLVTLALPHPRVTVRCTDDEDCCPRSTASARPRAASLNLDFCGSSSTPAARTAAGVPRRRAVVLSRVRGALCHPRARARVKNPLRVPFFFISNVLLCSRVVPVFPGGVVFERRRSRCKQHVAPRGGLGPRAPSARGLDCTRGLVRGDGHRGGGGAGGRKGEQVARQGESVHHMACRAASRTVWVVDARRPRAVDTPFGGAYRPPS